MVCSTCVSPSLDVPEAPYPARRTIPVQRLIGVVLLGAVIALDQGTKAWAWRHRPGTIINPGSTGGMGGPINELFSGPVSGAVLDFLNCGLLCLAGFALLRARRSLVVFIPGALLLAGWGSNLLDRLGMHRLSAPGSVRGAVDFISVGEHLYNVADVFIIGGTAVLLLAAIALPDLDRRVVGPDMGQYASAHRRPRRPSRRACGRTATVVVGLAALTGFQVVLGAVHYGGTDYSTASPDAIPQHDGDVGAGPAAGPGAVTPVALLPAGWPSSTTPATGDSPRAS